jgi:SAM-dependent methyltransferase
MIDADAFNAFEAEGWEGVAGSYHRFWGTVTANVCGPLLDAARVGPGTRTLDVATGPGYVAALAAERGASVVGLDVAEEMVALARMRQPGTEFVRGDAEELPFPDGSFDAVVANFMILHVAKPERAAAEAHRVLAPGGGMALSVWDVPVRARLMGVLVDAVAEVGAGPPAHVPEGPPFFRFSDDDEFRGLLKGAGFLDVAVQEISFAHHAASSDELWDGLTGATVRMAALVRGQDVETQRRIRDAFDRNVAQYEGTEGVDLPVSAKVAAGRRSS